MGVQAVLLGPAAFEVFGVPISLTVVMTLMGFLVGIVVGATPGLAGPIAMAIALPILISIFGVNTDALLPTRTGVGLSLRTVRTKTHKLTVYMQSDAGELYDLENDRHERVNLFDNANAAPLRAELEAMIAQRPDDAIGNQIQIGMA